MAALARTSSRPPTSSTASARTLARTPRCARGDDRAAPRVRSRVRSTRWMRSASAPARSRSSRTTTPPPIVAKFPTIVAAYARLSGGAEPIAPRTDLGHAANFLYMLSGEVPDAERVRALETYLNTVVDHGLNASTFTCRVITSTGSDLVSAVVGAVGALKGPLHGGAPGPALETVFEIG